MATRLFGLTGGIASGKSTVAARFQHHGVPVIDADLVARQVVAPGCAGLQQIVDAFGLTVLRADATLNREALAAIVFSDAQQRAQLNQIMHPLIRAEAEKQAEELAAQGKKLACYEAALLIEVNHIDNLRPLVLVTASEAVQQRRIMQRNGVSAAQAKARLAAQMPLAEKIKAADIVIPNDGSLDDLMQRADQALNEVFLRIGIPRDIGLCRV